MGKQWFTWAMLAAYIAIWAMVNFAGKLPAGTESPLRQSISDGFTSFLGLTIQVLIAVVGILFAGVITSQQRSLQRYGDFVLVLYRREYGYLGLYLGLTIATVLASILTGVQGWPFIIYHLLNLILLAGLIAHALPLLFFVPSRDNYLRLMRNFKRDVFHQLRRSGKSLSLAGFGKALRSLAYSREDVEWQQWLEELHDEAIKDLQPGSSGAEDAYAASYRSLLEELRQEPAHAGKITRFFYYSLGVALREKFTAPHEGSSSPLSEGLSQLAEDIAGLISTHGSAREFIRGLVSRELSSRDARQQIEDWLTGVSCKTDSVVLYEEWYKFLVGRIEQATEEIVHSLVEGQPVPDDLATMRKRYLQCLIKLTVSRPDSISDRLLQVLKKSWVWRDNHRMQSLVSNFEEQRGYILQVLVQDRLEFFASWTDRFLKNIHAISALGKLLGECHTTYIFVDEAELDQLPRPLRDQFRQLDHLVEWMMLQIFLTHEMKFFPFSRYARMWYLVPRDETEVAAYLQACRKYLRSRRHGVGIHDDPDWEKESLGSILSRLKRLKAEPTSRRYTSEIDECIGLVQNEVQEIA